MTVNIHLILMFMKLKKLIQMIMKGPIIVTKMMNQVSKFTLKL